jgi:hypothetical protein
MRHDLVRQFDIDRDIVLGLVLNDVLRYKT